MANRLKNEQSQYLLQHAHNPVDWHPWGDEAFAIATQRNCPVLVSIGYAACHWCHVMERESFENIEVAAYMNEHFVCIKVDREEHPDVDHLYMDAVQAINNSGGWPLNVFVTPQRAPFYGGTYYPPRPAYSRPSWLQVLQRMVQLWYEQKEDIDHQAQQLLEHLQNAAKNLMPDSKADRSLADCSAIADALLAQADIAKGGFGNAPKFPGTMAITYLLQHHAYTGHKGALDHALHSLNSMAAGGIYDQIGGGFARYSTDRNWLAPHFEKMLYDNALLISVYCDAWLITRNEIYRSIVDQTIAFAERELKEPTGGYYCALDADSEGVEGKFYTWSYDEFYEVLGADAPIAAAYWGVVPGGNWEHTNILHLPADAASVASAHGISTTTLLQIIDTAKAKLNKRRDTRPRPLTDDKCLLSWNALMNKALTKAAVTFQNQNYLSRAVQHMHWMLSSYSAPHGLLHTWKDGKARIDAKLDDYAYLIDALLQLASATGNNDFALKATRYTSQVINGFSHPEGFFYFTPEHNVDIPVRKVDLYDGATPSANSVMAGNLAICGMITEEPTWTDRADMMIRKMAATASRYPVSFGYWAQLLQMDIYGRKSAVFVGNNAAYGSAEFHMAQLPHVFTLIMEENEPILPVLENKFCDTNLLIFVCTQHACLPPVSSVRQAIELLNA